MKRMSNVEPGYDCVRHPCGKDNCGKTEGGNHGISSDDWTYVVTDGQIALVLRVSSGVFPESVPSDVVDRLAVIVRATDLALHTGFPLERESMRKPSAGVPCEYLDVPCYGAEGSILAADKLFGCNGGGASFEQPEKLWQALEAEWSTRKTVALADRADTRWAQCPHCGGEGTVRRTHGEEA